MFPASSLLAPLLSGLGYTIAALMLKRGSLEAGPWRTAFATNWLLAILYSLLWVLPPTHPASWESIGHAAISGVLFFIGQIFTFLALSRGDVSIATPVLGSKVIFVAFFTVLFGSGAIDGAMWIAVFLTAAATALFGGGGKSSPQSHPFWRSLVYGFCAAVSFAMMDITQQWWIPAWDFFHYMAALFITMGVLSLLFIPLFRHDGLVVSRVSWRWIAAGSTMLALQAGGIAWSIIHIGATRTNVLYNSRGLWSVVLVWTVGHWFGNTERGHGRAVMIRRFAGSLLMLAAIALIVLKPREKPDEGPRPTHGSTPSPASSN